ncbi:MAG TPA: 4-alpha-glucanotransferase [Lachnospiraceae bacterium]|nr:4-alpha-glucanotransferase [Lachnospiraceae bacterium]
MEAKSFNRGAGILLPIASLPSEYGIGTLGNAAYHFIDLLVDLRQKYWQVLPIGPTSFGDSPYQSFSAFAGNPYLIDLNTLIEDGLLSREEVRSYNWGSEENDIDYATIFENRFEVLQKAFDRFDIDTKEFTYFCELNQEWLTDYSFFMAVKTFSGNKEWLQWEAGLRNRNLVTMMEYEVILGKQISFWKFCQFQFFTQWSRLKKYANNRGIQIIGDIPLYTALDSADVWANRDEFLLNEDGTPKVVAGCPPDAFSDQGQKWGNPIYDWERMEKGQFSWWKKRMKASAGLFDIIRVDHFIGVVRYYSIFSDSLDGRNGKWNKGPGKKLTDAIKEAVGENRVIAEDLGVSIPGVKKLMAKTGWPGMKVLLFAFDGNTSNEHLPHNYTDTNIVLYAGTHDNDTVVGYFKDKTEYELAYLYEYLGISAKEEIPDAIIRLAYSSIADIVIIQMQDIIKLGNEARMNLPSTVGRNWRWRFKKDGLTEERRSWFRTLATIYRR